MVRTSPFLDLSSRFSRLFRRVPLLIFLTLFVAAIAGCGDSGSSHTSPPALPTATSLPASCTSVGAGAGYNCAIKVTGGKAPFKWTVTGLPSGLTSSVSADTTTLTITGTAPAQAVRAAMRASRKAEATPASTSTVTISVTDAKGVTAQITFTITINPLTLGTTSLSDGMVGTAYSASVSVTGGLPPYTINITGLPTGLNASGASISGTPTQSGTFTVTVAVTDSEATPASVQATLSLTISAPPPLGISTSTLTGGTAGAVYMTNVTANGGVTPYHWTITGLPSGITFTSGTPSASVSGTTDDVGTFTVSAMVTDSAPTPARVSATLTLVIAQAAAVVITTTTLQNGTINVAYSQTLKATGGVAPYTWTKTAGNFPAGLTLATTGMISGTPTATGTSSFTVQVADSESPAQTKTAALSITVNAPAACALSGKQLAIELAGTTSAGPAGLLISVNVASDGSVTGISDFRTQSAVSAGQSVSGPAGSCSDYGVAGTGTMAFSDGGTPRMLRFAMRPDGTRGFVDESDSSGFSGAGQIQVQTAPTVGLANGSYAYGAEGASNTLFAYVTGAFCTNSSNALTFLQSDFTVSLTFVPMVTAGSNPGAFSMADAHGRLTTTSPFSFANGTTADLTVYNLDGSKAFVLATGGSFPNGTGGTLPVPVEVGLITGKQGSGCMPTTSGAFSNSSLGDSVFSAQGLDGATTPFTMGAFIGALKNFNPTAGTVSVYADELIGGVGKQTNTGETEMYSLSPVGRLDLAITNSSGKISHSFAYLDGIGNGYVTVGDPKGEGIAFGIVSSQSAATLTNGTYALGAQIGTPFPVSLTFLPVTEVSISGTTIMDLASGGSSGTLTCGGGATGGRCTGMFNTTNTFGDTNIVAYVGGDYLVAVQTTAANAQPGMLSH